MRDIPVAIEPFYKTDSTNESIELHAGPAVFAVEGGDPVDGSAKIRAAWGPSPRIAFEFTSEGEGYPPIGYCQLRLLDLDAWAQGYAEFANTSIAKPGDAQTTTTGLLLPGLEFERGGALMSARFHLLNFFHFDGSAIRRGNSVTRGRMDASAAGWTVTIDSLGSRPLGPRVGGYSITHVGDLRRTDGSSFVVSELQEVTEALRMALSFAAGMWIAPLFVVGLNEQGERVSEQWVMPRVDERQRLGWFPTDSPEHAEPYLECFFRRWLDADVHAPIELAISQCLEANTNEAVQPSIALEQMGLELVAWLTLVQDLGVLSADGFGQVAAHDQIRLLLGWAGVSREYPPGLPSLRRFGEQARIDAPEAFTRVRNRIVHPPKRSTSEQIPLDIMADAQRLGLWYLELAILRFLGYDGRYVQRMRVSHEEDVPWRPPDARG